MEGQVLVADDNATLASLFADALRRGGFEVHIATDGREALNWLATTVPLAILLDIEMPHVDGRDVLSRLSRDPRLATVPVLVVTGRDDEYLTDYVISLGARDVLIKPVSTAEVVARVRRLLLS